MFNEQGVVPLAVAVEVPDKEIRGESHSPVRDVCFHLWRDLRQTPSFVLSVQQSTYRRRNARKLLGANDYRPRQSSNPKHRDTLLIGDTSRILLSYW